MLKNTDKYDNTAAHFTYGKYRGKTKTKKAPNNDMAIFISVFIIGVLIILGFAKILSPNVDVAITNENELSTEYQDEENTASFIDDRLKRLQMEDTGVKEGEEEMFSPELDEKVILPKQRSKTVGEMEAEMADLMNSQQTEQAGKEKSEQITGGHTNEQKSAQTGNSNTSATEPDDKTTASSAPSPAPSQIVNARVVVGYYATDKQAEVAKSIIQDAGLGITPVVKNLGGYYTLQVGAYTSREKAQQAANNLLKSNFPARVIVE